MSIKTLLTTNYRLPPFSRYRHSLLLAFIYVLIPNIFFLAVAWFTGLARPLVNLDYLLPLLIFSLPLPWRLGQILGYMTLILAALMDVAMFAIQVFPFLDLAAIRYLLPFISTAPSRLLWLMAIFVLYLIILPWVIQKIQKHTSCLLIFIATVIIASLGWFTRDMMYHQSHAMRFGQANYFVAGSQTEFYLAEMGNSFAQLTQTKPIITPNQKENATRRFRQPYANKILLIVAESWGVAREETVKQALLEKIYQQQSNLEFIETGYFDFFGATVQGEMRELCNFNTANGYAFSQLPTSIFENCLPNILKRQNYQTIGLHGATSQLYDRDAWYPMVGFSKTIFGEHLADMPRCYAFNGVCDEQMLNLVAKEFQQAGQNKVFVYWLSLTAHLPYDVSAMRSNRFDCDKLNVTVGDICNNMRLQSQLFDDLGEIIQRPEMKGVEVIVVGDHMPPIMGDVPLYKNLRWNDVPWLHFKVKE